METDKYIFFYGHQRGSYRSFSQWYPVDFEETIDGKKYKLKHAEQAMMLKKALLFDDYKTADKILKATTPYECKTLGRNVKSFDDEVWNQNKFGFVVKTNFEKFSQNKHLLDILLGTQNKILVEASPYDKIWGIGMSVAHPNITNENHWRGENLLGKALMVVRKTINVLNSQKQ